MSERDTDTIKGVEAVLPGETATVRAAHESLKGDRRGIRKLIPLLIFCRNRNIMGVLTSHRLTTAVATVVVTLNVSLNVFLLYQTFFG
jgi:hypothetical protein